MLFLTFLSHPEHLFCFLVKMLLLREFFLILLWELVLLSRDFFFVVTIFFLLWGFSLLSWEFFFWCENFFSAEITFFLLLEFFFAVRTFLLKILLSMMRILKAKSLKSKKFWQTMQKRSGGLCRSSLELRARSF